MFQGFLEVPTYASPEEKQIASMQVLSNYFYTDKFCYFNLLKRNNIKYG